MKSVHLIIAGLLVVSSATFAQDKTPAPMDHSKMQGMDHSKMATRPAVLNIAPAAKDAVAAVDRPYPRGRRRLAVRRGLRVQLDPRRRHD